MSEYLDDPDFRFEHLDVNDENQIEGIFERLGKDGWEPNVVLNNAAITGELLMGAGKEFPELSDTTLSDWNRTIQTNLTGAFLIAREMDRDIVGKYPSDPDQCCINVCAAWPSSRDLRRDAISVFPRIFRLKSRNSRFDRLACRVLGPASGDGQYLGTWRCI